MNNKFKILALVILAGAFSYKACKKDEGVYAEADRVGTTPNVLPNGTWKISFFKLNGTDKTADFEQERFQFDRNGTVIASSGLTEIKGTWSIGANDDPNFFSIDFRNGIRLSQLDGGWKIRKADNFVFDTDRLGRTRSLKDVLDFEKVEMKSTLPTMEK